MSKIEKIKSAERVLVICPDRYELKLALVNRGKGPALIHSLSLPMPEGALEDGYLLRPGAVRELLRGALEQPQFKGCRRAELILCTTRIITDTLTVPAMRGKKLQKMLQSNMDIYFPVDSADYELLWNISGKKRRKGGRTEQKVQLWAVPKNIMDPYFELAADCGLRIGAVQWSGSSLVSFAGSFEPEEGKGARVYAAAEREHIVIAVLEGGRLRAARVFLQGPDREAGLRELSLMKEYCDAAAPGEGGFILGGALAGDGEFLSLARRELGLSVRVAERPEMMLPLGAAPGDRGFALPVAELGKGRAGELGQYALIFLSGLVLAGSIAFSLGSAELMEREIAELEEGLRLMEQSLSGAAEDSGEYERYMEAYEAYSADWDGIFAAVRSSADALVPVLEELEGLLPKGARVTEMDIRPRELELEILCSGKEEAAYVIMRLREMKNAEILDVSGLYGRTGEAAKPLPAEEAASGGGSGVSSSASASSWSGEAAETLLELIAGGSDLSGLSEDERAAALAFGLEKGYIGPEDAAAEVEALSMEELLLFDENYSSIPQTEMSPSFLQSEAKSGQKGEAFELMLRNDPIALHRFARAFRENFEAGGDEGGLFGLIREALESRPGMLAALFSGGEEELANCVGELSHILQADEATVAAAESLICSDEALAKRYAWYLERVLYWEGELPAENPCQSPDADRIGEDILNASLPAELSSGAREAARDIRDALILKMFSSGRIGAGELTELLGRMEASAAPRPSPDADMDDLAELLDKLLGGNKGSGETAGPTSEPETAETGIYFDVVLAYAPEAIPRYRELGGLGYADKLQPPGEREVEE